MSKFPYRTEDSLKHMHKKFVALLKHTIGRTFLLKMVIITMQERLLIVLILS